MGRDLSVGWWNDLARSILGYQEQQPLELEDLIRAVVALEVDRREWGFIKKEHWFATAETGVTAVAAEFGFLGLSNPVDSGVLTVLEGIANTSVGQEMQPRQGKVGDVTFTPAIAVTSVVTGGLDGRNYQLNAAGATVAPNAATRLITGTATAAEAGFAAPAAAFPAENVVQGQHALLAARRYKVVLGPGDLWTLMSTLVNSTVSAWFIFRERPLHKGVRA